VVFIDTPVASVLADDDDVLVGVRLVDDTVVPADAVVVAPRMVANVGPVSSLGLEVAEAPMGRGSAIATGPTGATSVAGVYAAGNAADVSNQVLQAAADGSRIAAVINADLAEADTDLALAVSSGARA
jgi:thioredoxin reductase